MLSKDLDHSSSYGHAEIDAITLWDHRAPVQHNVIASSRAFRSQQLGVAQAMLM